MTSPPPDREPPRPAPAAPKPRPPVAVSAGPVTVEFQWLKDRWGHVVTVAGRRLAASVEGTADGAEAAWPASPPLVELSTVVTARGPAVLAVGLAGRSHYSASIAPHPEVPDTLLFEVACRIRDRPAWLGSTYDLDGSRLRIVATSPGDTPPATVRWAYTVGPGGFTAVPPATVVRGR